MSYVCRRCLTIRPMSRLRFCRATLSRDKIASVTWCVEQLLNSPVTVFFSNRAVLYSWECWTLIGQFLFMRHSCRVCDIKTLSHDKVARQSCATKLQVARIGLNNDRTNKRHCILFKREKYFRILTGRCRIAVPVLYPMEFHGKTANFPCMQTPYYMEFSCHVGKHKQIL